ncbi:hypothetical protein ACJMK2_011762 [Sinanodonta woodiana]|uniref:Nose resistant-to-fluoxetine protein N-terminal domain-containing protein n=1 Tax=Sinanodonta woodiana TaxID=1069815 RepID=A0ABD3V7A4_SINWO
MLSEPSRCCLAIVCFVTIMFGYGNASYHNLEHHDVLDLTYIGIPVKIPMSKYSRIPHDTQILLNEMKDGLVTKSFIAAVSVEHIPRNDSQSSETSPYCANDIQRFITDLTRTSQNASVTYAYQMLDASSKLPSGILQGRWFWPGAFEECMEILSPVLENATGSKQIQGQYFSVAVYIDGKAPFPVGGGKSYPLVTGICMPGSCSNEEVQGFLNYVVFPYLRNQIHITLTAVDVEAMLPQTYSSGAKAALAVCGVFVFLALVGTCLDFFKIGKLPTETSDPNQDRSAYFLDQDTTLLLRRVNPDNINSPAVAKVRWMISFFKCFSIISNAKKLVDTKTAVGPLACLNGIRVISMWWVIQGHTYTFASLCDNLLEASKIMTRFTFQPIANGTFSVDSFFFLSGLLVTYLSLKSWTDRGKMNWAYYFLHRYWRLTPLYAIVVMIFGTLFPLMVSGPYQYLVSQPDSVLTQTVNECTKSWWANLIYINNFYPHYGDLSMICAGWTWYLANDMQFYIFLSPICIFLLYKWKKLGIAVTSGLILLCIGIRVFLVSYYEISGLLDVPTKHAEDPMAASGPMYQRPYARMAVYLVGTLTGYLLYRTQCHLRLNKMIITVGWIVAISSALAVIYGPYQYNRDNVNMPVSVSMLYTSVSRTVWAVCLAWLVIACVSGKGGPVNQILSWKIWAPLGRLTFAAYLVHPVTIYIFYLNLRLPIHFTDLTMIYYYMANLITAYTVAFVISMMVEAPMLQLEKLILGR